MNQFWEILTLIGITALVTTIVSHPASASVISAMGGAYSGAIRAALGN